MYRADFMSNALKYSDINKFSKPKIPGFLDEKWMPPFKLPNPRLAPVIPIRPPHFSPIFPPNVFDLLKEAIKDAAASPTTSYQETPLPVANPRYLQDARDELLRNKVIFEDGTIRYGFRDRRGFVIAFVNQDNLDSNAVTSKPDQEGEATFFTAIAAIALATDAYGTRDEWETQNLDEELNSLLLVLRDQAWGNADQQGKKYPIRHPDDLDFDADGNVLRAAPLSKDAFGAIVCAGYYAYMCPALPSNSKSKATARSLVNKWIDFLVDSGFWIHPPSRHITNEWASEGKDYKNIFNSERRRKLFKGRETFFLSPFEFLALKYVAAELGFSLGVIPSAILQAAQIYNLMISYAAPVIARVASQALNEILKLLTFQEHVKFGLGPVDWALGAVEDIFEIIIPDSVREKIVKQFENFIADTIREFIKVGTIPFDIVTTAVDRILDFFPDELGKNSWKTVLLGAISDIMPWLSFEAIWELLILIAGIEALKYPTMPESNIAFLMWSYTAVCETRPDYAAILHPILDEFFKFLRGNDNANGTWAWLAGDGGRVADEINLFETHNLRNWESFAFGSTKFGEWERKIPKILKERPGVPPNTFEKEFPRIDYLVLHGLREKGPPKLLTTTIGNWFNNFLNFAKEALKKFIEWLKRKFNEGLKFVQEVLAEGYRVVKKIYEKVTTALGDTYQYAEEIFMNGVRVARKLYDQFGNVLENFYEDAGRFVEEVWDSAGNFISKGIFRAGSMIERTFMKEGQKIIDAWRTGVADFSRQIFNSSGLKTFEAIARGVFSEEIFTSIGSLLKTVWKFAPNYLSIGSVDLNAAISRLENWGSSVVNHTWNETLNGIKYIGEQLWEGVKVFTRTAETLANGLYQEVVIPFSKSLREVTKWWANEAGKAIDMVKRQVLEPTGQVIDEVWTWTGAKVDQYTKEVWKDMSRFTKQSIETITIGLSYTVKLFNDAGREISRLIADGVGRIIEATGVFVNKTADAIGDILTGLNPAHWDVDFGIDIPLPWSL